MEYGRRHGLKANMALGEANNKFLRRFNAMEGELRLQKKDVAVVSLDALNALWETIKAAE